MIFKGSRYQNTPVLSIATPAGKTVQALAARYVPVTPAGYLHTFSGSERLDLLAYRFYANPEKFWLIADANAAMDPEDLLTAGAQLRIPPDRS
ncbi:MAG TPA: LysM domain-containing protein [Acidobacteriaceae bacterium]